MPRPLLPMKMRVRSPVMSPLVELPKLVPPLPVKFPLSIASRSSIFEEPSLYGELTEDEYWHQRKE